MKARDLTDATHPLHDHVKKWLAARTPDRDPKVTRRAARKYLREFPKLREAA